jgi:hypothetical protein
MLGAAVLICFVTGVSTGRLKSSVLRRCFSTLFFLSIVGLCVNALSRMYSVSADRGVSLTESAAIGVGPLLISLLAFLVRLREA